MQFEGASKGKNNRPDRKKTKRSISGIEKKKNQCLLNDQNKKRTEEYLPACHLAAACALRAAMTAPASDARARAAAEGALKWEEDKVEEEGGSIDDEEAAGGAAAAAPGAPAAAAAEAAAAAASVVVIAALVSRGKERKSRRRRRRRNGKETKPFDFFSCASNSRFFFFV